MGIYNSDEMKVIIDEYGDTVYRMALIQGKNTEAADVIYRKVFMKLTRNKIQLPFGETTKIWLLKETLKCGLKRNGYQSAGTVTECVQKLPKLARNVFHLHYYEGYKLAELSEFWAISEKTAAENLEQCEKKLPQILDLERVREPENYLERYREELDNVRHNPILDEKILEKADKHYIQITRKHVIWAVFIAVILVFHISWLWSYMSRKFHYGQSIPYIINSWEGVEISLDEVTPTDFELDKFLKLCENTKWSDYFYDDFNTYEEFYENTGLELLGAEYLEYFNFSASVREKETTWGTLYEIGNLGEARANFLYKDETYSIYAYYKIKDYSEEDAVIRVQKEKANYSYEYAQGKYAYFICNGYNNYLLTQDVYLVEDGILYCIDRVDATMEATETVKEILEVMVASEQ